MVPFCTVKTVMSLPKGNLNKSTGVFINLMNQLHNNVTADNKENELKWRNCKYREIYYFQKILLKLQKEFSKRIFLLGNINTDLIKMNFQIN